jgi:hypothetical protein
MSGAIAAGAADHAGKSLETWLRDKFFTQHCALLVTVRSSGMSGMACAMASVH